MADNQHPASKIRPFIIPIFIPHAGCPYQCVFCNQVSITGANQRSLDATELHSHIGNHLSYKSKNRKPVEIAFFGGNFLGLEEVKIRSFLESAAGFIADGRVDGIRFSTRPDTIHARTLEIVDDYPVSTVELGVQSMDNRVLALAGRGHNALDTIRAVGQLKKRHLSIGLQMMVGLPGDDENVALATAQKIIGLQPDFVRIYPTLVVENSRLARWHRRGDYTPLSLEEGVTLVKKVYLKFNRAGIKVIRMGLQASGDLEEGTTVLGGPHHPAFGHLVHSEIFLDMAVAAIKRADSINQNLTISVHPRSISKMRGLNNSNVEILKKRHQYKSISVVPNSALLEDELKVG
ncbi:MAG: radical SAM protein [Desulfobacterales bacterium]|jgi:histone acetyltransferase (RNA polymerase elongator complex component)